MQLSVLFVFSINPFIFQQFILVRVMEPVHHREDICTIMLDRQPREAQELDFALQVKAGAPRVTLHDRDNMQIPPT